MKKEATVSGMDPDDLEELATELHGKGSQWDLFQIAPSIGLVLYAAWPGSLALGIRKVFVQANLSDCSNLTVFLAPSMVPPLERKLLSELPDEACVVAARFPLLTWTPSKDAGESLEKAWAYNIKDVQQAKQDTSGGGPAKD